MPGLDGPSARGQLGDVDRIAVVYMWATPTACLKRNFPHQARFLSKAVHG